MSVVTRIRTSQEVTVPFTPEEVWDVLADVAAYPGWWPVKLAVELLHDPGDLLGAELEVRPLMGRMFRIRFEELENRRTMRLRFFGGSLEGPGGFHLRRVDGGTEVRFEMDVFARGLDVAAMSLVLPLEFLHRARMRSVLNSLAGRLEALRRASEREAANAARRLDRETAIREGEQEAARRAEEGEARKRAEEKAAAKKRAAEEEAARRAAEEEARKRAEEEAAARAAAEEAERRAEEEESARRAAEEEARKRAEEEAAARAAAQEAERRAAEEESARRATEEEARKRAEEEAAARAAAEEAERRAEEEEAVRRAAEEEARKRAEEEAAARAAAQEAERRAAEEEAARRALEEEARKRAEEEVAARAAAQEAERRAAEEEAARRALEDEAKKRAEEEAAARAAAQEAERRAAEEEAARRAAEEEARKRAEEEAAARAAAQEAERRAAREAEEAEEEARQNAERAAAAQAAIVATSYVPGEVDHTHADERNTGSTLRRLWTRLGDWFKEAPTRVAEPIDPPQQTLRETNFEIARRYLVALSGGAGADEIGGFFAPEASDEEFPHRFRETAVTRDFAGILEARSSALTRFASQRYELLGATGGGSSVAMEVRWKGTVAITGDGFLEGQELDARVAMFLKFADARIVRQRAYPCFEPWSTRAERLLTLDERVAQAGRSMQAAPHAPAHLPVPSPGSNFDIARRYLEALGSRADAETIGAYYAADAVQDEFPNRLLPGGAHRDLLAIKLARSRGLLLMASETYELLGATGGGSQVALEVAWSGLVGEGLGLFTTGQRLEARTGIFLKFRDGLIVTQRNYDCA